MQASLALLYVGIFPSIFSYLLYNNGVRVLGSKTASLCSYLIPVFTAIMGVVLLSEKLELFHFISQLMVFSGFCFALFGRKHNSQKP